MLCFWIVTLSLCHSNQIVHMLSPHSLPSCQPSHAIPSFPVIPLLSSWGVHWMSLCVSLFSSLFLSFSFFPVAQVHCLPNLDLDLIIPFLLLLLFFFHHPPPCPDWEWLKRGAEERGLAMAPMTVVMTMWPETLCVFGWDQNSSAKAMIGLWLGDLNDCCWTCTVPFHSFS